MSENISISQIGLAAMALLNIKNIGSNTARRHLDNFSNEDHMDGKASFLEIAARLRKTTKRPMHGTRHVGRQRIAHSPRSNHCVFSTTNTRPAFDIFLILP